MNQVVAATLRISWRHRGRHFAFDSRFHFAVLPYMTHYIWNTGYIVYPSRGGDFRLAVGVEIIHWYMNASFR